MRRFLLFLTVISLILFSGCSQYSQSDMSPSGDKVVLTVLAGQSTSDAGTEEMVNKKVAQEFPQVELEWETMDWGDYFHSQMQARFASGEIPDIMIGKAQDVATYYPLGVLAPFPKNLVDLIREEALIGTRFGGEVYGIPYNALYQGVVYNKNIFWRYNLEPPRSLSQMKVVVEKLRRVGVTPFATHFRETWFTANVTMQFALNQVFPASPEWGEQFRKGKVSFAQSEDMQDCLRQVKFLLDHSWPDALTVSQQESDKRFIQEKAAMYITGSWSFQAIQAMAPSMEVGIFPYPNREGTASLIFEPNMTIMKSVASSSQELIDRILLALLKDGALAESIYSFTQTASVLKEVKPQYPALIEGDISAYSKAGRIMDSTVGNTQLRWDFQDQLAAVTQDWIEGRTDFNSVLVYADQNKMNSGRTE